MNHFDTIILSDIHLGNPNSRTEELLFFLKNNKADSYILNGDIIDMWSIRRGSRWNKSHTQVMRKFLKLSYKNKVTYLRGNHDDFLDDMAPIIFGNLRILKEMTISVHGSKSLVLHGDVFDLITTTAPWLSFIGGYLYDAILWVNRKYNRVRERFGAEQVSLSKIIKNKVKSAVNYVSNFESQLSGLARQRGADAIICGHIHNPEIRDIDGILYMNSGDWVENCTALVHDEEGWKIIRVSKIGSYFHQQTIMTYQKSTNT